MAYEFKLPDLGEGVAEGEVVRWLVREGDTVAEDQPLAEVLTDKATVEIPSPRAGRILKLGAAEGERVPVGHVLVEIEETDAGSEGASSNAQNLRSSDETPPAPASDASPNPSAADTGPSFSPTVRPAAKEAAGLLRAVEATPAVRALARELGVDLTQVEGTGPGGRLLPDDVKRAAASTRSPVVATAVAMETEVPASGGTPESGTAGKAPQEEERVALRGMRRRIAEAMTRTHALVPQFTFVAEADVDAIMADRERRKPEAEAQGVRLTFVSYVLRALGPSLHAFPSLNASLDDEKQEIVIKKHIHVAVAVAAPDGLTVPVVYDADKLGLLDLAREVGRLADAARSNALKPEELSGATFTVTTTGAKGGVLATPLVHHPQVAILGIHAVTPRPVVRDGQIVIRRMVNLSLSLDHRVVDGQQGADFLYDVIARLESPLEGWL
ncbi:MAG TPA: dihydrolipoamide acetyltransferase family protein [Candidatus Eisenbacteria bacterium]|nr:dihydrolipoamide acetyltransferase family protein [Candidatus Eisenbacteria bacterium]